jgi:hypothetical protein
VTTALAQQARAIKDESLGWLNRLEQPEAAEWAVQTTRQIINALLALTPHHDSPERDPLSMFKPFGQPRRFEISGPPER